MADLRAPRVVQVSYQKEVELPEEITFLKPESRVGLATLQVAQVREQAPLESQGEQVVRLEMYLARKTIARGKFSPVESFQSSLARRAKFLGRAA